MRADFFDLVYYFPQRPAGIVGRYDDKGGLVRIVDHREGRTGGPLSTFHCRLYMKSNDS